MKIQYLVRSKNKVGHVLLWEGGPMVGLALVGVKVWWKAFYVYAHRHSAPPCKSGRYWPVTVNFRVPFTCTRVGVGKGEWAVILHSVPKIKFSQLWPVNLQMQTKTNPSMTMKGFALVLTWRKTKQKASPQFVTFVDNMMGVLLLFERACSVVVV